MDKRRFLKTAVSLAALSQAPALHAMKARPLRLAVFPRRNASLTYSMFLPLVRYLGDSIGRDIRLEVFKDFQAFWESFEKKQHDLVHFNQYHYILARNMFGYQAIARNLEFGSSTISGSLIIRKDSGIRELADLRNKTILFGGGPRAMQSYIAPVWLLRQAGLEKGDYREEFAINPPNAVISTYLRRASAAGTGDVIIRLQMVKNNIDVSQMDYLARTEPMAHLPWAIHPSLDQDMKEHIQRTMVEMGNTPSGQEILDNMRLSGLVPASDNDYKIHESMIRDVYGDDLGAALLG